MERLELIQRLKTIRLVWQSGCYPVDYESQTNSIFYNGVKYEDGSEKFIYIKLHLYGIFAIVPNYTRSFDYLYVYSHKFKTFDECFESLADNIISLSDSFKDDKMEIIFESIRYKTPNFGKDAEYVL